MIKIYKEVNEDCKLSENLYRRTLYTIKDYEAIKRRVNTYLDSECEADNHMKIAKDFEKYSAIMEAMLYVPREYRDGVFFNIVNGAEYPDTAVLKTWKKWKQVYIYHVALLMGESIS